MRRGGGGVNHDPGTPPPTPTPTPTPPPPPTPTAELNYDTHEYRNSNYATAANAISAYNAGYTGKGVKIGIVDSGINPNLSEFTGKIDPASGDVAGNSRRQRRRRSRNRRERGRGGGAQRLEHDGRRFRFDHRQRTGRRSGLLRRKDGCQFYDTAIASGIDAARQAGVRVINLSLGGSQPGTALLAAMQRAVNAGIVIVISAGNDGADPTKARIPIRSR